MRVIAITGAGQGIGRALAWQFVDAGYIVAITDKDRAAGREALQGIKESGTDGLFLAGDVSNPAHVARWMNGVVKKFAVPDVLINNAGTMIRKDVLKLSIAEFDSVIAANLRGHYCAPGRARRCARRYRQDLPIPGGRCRLHHRPDLGDRWRDDGEDYLCRMMWPERSARHLVFTEHLEDVMQSKLMSSGGGKRMWVLCWCWRPAKKPRAPLWISPKGTI